MSYKPCVTTTLHKNCGGQVLSAHPWMWKTQLAPKQDGTLYCCLCNQQPVPEEDTYEDMR